MKAVTRQWVSGAAALAMALPLLLAGCASPPPAPEPASYVVLLDNGDGSIGKVLVSTAKGITLLERPREGRRFADPPGATFDVSQTQIDADFGAALAASPAKPVTFLLYFAAGGAKLNPESEAEVDRVSAEIAARPTADVSVIGHTDTAGDADTNEKLGLVRARFVGGLLINRNTIDASKIAIESHGKTNLLVPTPDNTSEPRNRRVEVTVR